MNELIQIAFEGANPSISGRELHKALEVQTAYKDWFPRMCEYGFTDGADFNPLKIEQVQIEGNREVKREVTDHQITIPMAKELCMLQRTPKGKEIRQYLIKVEEAWNTPEKIMARALQIAQRTLDATKAEVAKLAADNAYKEEVITGLTEDISLDDKRAILNRVIRKGFGSSEQQRDRWACLYKNFENVYHVTIERGIDRYERRMCAPWKKSKLEFVEKQMGMLDELFAVAVKLYETDVKKIQKELFGER